MTIKWILLAGLSLVFATALAQTRVKVINAETSQQLAGAVALLPEMHLVLKADSAGLIFLPAMSAPHIAMCISAPGFATVNEIIQTGVSEWEVGLVPQLVQMREVVVSAREVKLQGVYTMPLDVVFIGAGRHNGLVTITDKLASVAGVQQLSTGNGIGKPVIRGLAGNRIVTYSQGMRLENQQWGDEHGLGVDEAGIESVEVIKGPASLIYGADALGGVLYFVDEAFAPLQTAQARYKSQYFSNTNGWDQQAALKLSGGNLRFNLFGRHHMQQDYLSGGANGVANTRFNNQSLRGSLGFNIRNWYSVWRYGLLNEHYGLHEEEIHNDELQGGIMAYQPMAPHQHLGTHTATSENTLYLGKSRLKFTAGAMSNVRKEYEAENDGDHVHTPDEASLDMLLQTATLNVQWHSGFDKQGVNYILGTQGMWQSNANRGHETLIPDAQTRDLGLFATGVKQWKSTSRFQAGLRYDLRFLDADVHMHDSTEHHEDEFYRRFGNMSLAAGFTSPSNRSVQFRVNAASGFRPPNTFELLSDGEHEGTRRYEFGNANLHTERGYQLDFACDFSTAKFSLSVAPYVHFIQNYIFLQPLGYSVNDLPAFAYRQAHSLFRGFEAEAQWIPQHVKGLSAVAAYDAVFASELEGPALPMIPAQRAKLVLNGNLYHSTSGNRSVQYYFQIDYVVAQRNITEFEMPSTDYTLLSTGLEANWQLGSWDVHLNVGVRNLTDKRYASFLSRYRYMGVNDMGRNFYIALTIPFHTELKK